MQRPLPSTAEVDRALREVYSRPEFAERKLVPWLQWVVDRWNALKAAFREVVTRLEVLERTAPVLYWLIVGWLVLSALAILAHFGATAYGAWRGRERTSAAAREGEIAPRGPLGAAEWEAEARRAAAEGRLRDAALALYQALLLRLDARGVVRYDPAKTPGEYRWEAMARGEAAVLEPFLRGFEPVAFGGRALDGAGYERLRRIAAEGGVGG